MISRIPIRWRLSLAFAAIVAVLTVIAGSALRNSVHRTLDESVSVGLRARADEIATLGSGGARGLLVRPGRISDAQETFAQIVDADLDTADPRVVVLAWSDERIRTASLLGAGALRRARTAGVSETELASVPGVEGRVRVLARHRVGEGPYVLVGASLDDRDEAVASLTRALWIGGPILFALVAGLGFLLTGAALRPVERMRAGAAALSGDVSGPRLPLSPAKDELRRLGETLNALLARVDDARERERAFVADASHELRTPVSIIAAEIELALAPGSTEEQLRAALTSCQEEVDRLTALTDELLMLARSEGAGIALRREQVDLADLLERVARRFASRATSQGRAVRVGDAAGVVDADPVRLEQALAALVDNGLRHGTGVVTLSAERVGDTAVLRVADEGQGIQGDLGDRALERFGRGHGDRAGGTGLGLAIVRAIAQSHGGDALIERDDAGTPRVVVRIPAG